MRNLFNMSINRCWLALLCVVSFTLPVWAQTEQSPSIQWQRVVEATSDTNRDIFQMGSRIVKSSQEGYFVLTGDRRLLSLSVSGDIIFNKPIDGLIGGDQLIGGIASTSDGGVVVCVRDSAGWLMQKRNMSGTTMWTHRFRATSKDFYYFNADIVASSDGGFIAFGTDGYRNPRNGSGYVTAYKVDRNGIFLWNRSIFSASSVNQAMSTDEGGYLLAGHAEGPPYSNYSSRVWVCKLDELGNILWQKRYQNMLPLSDFISYRVIPGSYLLQGLEYSDSSHSFNSQSLLIDSEGNTIKSDMPVSVPIIASNSASIIVATPIVNRQSSYIISNSVSKSMYDDVSLTGFSDQSTPIWMITLGGSGKDYFSSIIATDDGFIAVGATESTDGDVVGKNNTRAATWIVKLVSPIITGTTAQVEAVHIELLGNPAHEQVGVRVRGAQGQSMQLRLTDLQGRLLESRLVEHSGIVEEQHFQLDRAAPGLLLLQATIQHQTYLLKIVKP